MIISMIVATSDNDIIGKDNKLPWHIPEELKLFKQKTINHTVVMGKNTFLSLKSPLPKRTNIVVSTTLQPQSRILIARSIEEAFQLIPKTETEAFIIGGSQIFTAFRPYLNKIYLTRVHLQVEGNVKLPFPIFTDKYNTKQSFELFDVYDITL